MTIIYAILIFCMLIFVHEFGHFIVAKACGVKVNEFAIGMGPAIFKKQKGETLYAIRILPIGGFCAMEGEDEDSDDDRAFNNHPAWQKALVLAAGPFMNLLTAVVIAVIICCCIGQPTTTIDEVMNDSPAYKAGIMPGDKIVEVDGTAVKEWNDATSIIGENSRGTAEITIERDGNLKEITVPVEYSSDSGRKQIGIVAKADHNPIAAVGNGIEYTWNMTASIFIALKQLICGEVSVKDMSGPVGIVYAVNVVAKQGFINVMSIASFLSINLAIMNLLPLPALDGGRLLFLLIRKIAGSRITDVLEGKVHFIGIILLMMLMVLVTWNDIVRFVAPIFS